MNGFDSFGQTRQYNGTTTQYVYVRKSKKIIDEIDTLLQKLYGLTDTERDFIIKYQEKFRMGTEYEGETGSAYGLLRPTKRTRIEENTFSGRPQKLVKIAPPTIPTAPVLPDLHPAYNQLSIITPIP